jgi:hypothetical protein
VNRLAFGLLFAAATLAGCKEPAPGGEASQFVRSGQDVVVHSVRIYSSPENSVQGDTVYVVNFTYTNTQTIAFAPKIQYFIFEDQDKVRHTGLDGGSVVTAGLPYYQGVLKQGESHDYTVGFRCYQNASGILYYDPTGS